MKDNAMQVAMILDRSGSMSSIQGATVEGMNAFLAEQQNSTAQVSLLLVQFDDQYDRVFSGPIAEAPMFTLAEQPASNQVRFEPRGSTALLDAIGRTLTEVGQTLAALSEDQRPAKVVIVTMTDGQENHSRLFSRHQIAEMIRIQREVYKWEFQFLAANQDAISTASAINIPMANSITYAATGEGTRTVMRAASRNVRDYSIASTAAPMPAFQPEDRKAALAKDKA